MLNQTTFFAPACSQNQQARKNQAALEQESIQYRSLPTSTTNAITEKRRKLLQKIMTRLNAFDKENDLYKVNELCALHHPGHFSPFAKDPDGKFKYNMDYDAEGRDDKGRTRLHAVTQYKFQPGAEIRKRGNHALIAYISWNDFVANIYYMFPGEATTLMKITSSLAPQITSTSVRNVLQYSTFQRGDLPAFDLHKVHDQAYRIFYLQKDPQMRTVISKQSDEVLRQNPAKRVWFCISDLFRFYTANRDNTMADGDTMYDALKGTYQEQLDKLRNKGKLRSLNTDENEEYMRSETFDTEFLRLLPSPFARAIYKALAPSATFQPIAEPSIHQHETAPVLRIEDLLESSNAFAGHRSMLGEGVVHGPEQVQRTSLECRQKISESPDGSEKTAIIDQADRRTGMMTRTGSTVLASVIESNQRRLEGTVLEIEEVDMQRAEVEEEFINENLPVNDPLRALRTNPISETSGIIMRNTVMELELKKYEIEAQQATRRHELSLLSEERSLKIREDAITERQTITEREETQRQARQAEEREHNERERQETARKTQEARILNLEARRAEADPEARKAEAHTDALRAQARIEEAKTKNTEAAASRKRRNSQVLERGPLSPLQNVTNRLSVSAGTPIKTPVKRRRREQQNENSSPQVNAVFPRTFVPPRYSDGYTRPRRGSVA